MTWHIFPSRSRERKHTTLPQNKKPIPLPVVYTDMDTIRGIPTKYLYIACSVLSFIMFYAGGVAFNQNVFYGGLFIILALVIFFLGIALGKKSHIVE